MSEEKSTDTPVTGEGATDTRYVGFCDILGFSNRILTDFDKTLEVYRQFGSALSSLPVEGVTVTMYSDALVGWVVALAWAFSKDANPVVSAVPSTLCASCGKYSHGGATFCAQCGKQLA